MKKLVLILFLGFVTVVGKAIQSPDYTVVGTEVITSCGTRLMTVSPSFFNSNAEFNDYLRDLNQINCGTRDLPRIITHINTGF